MFMYSEQFGRKIEAQDDQINDVFDQICQGKPKFTFQDYSNALDENPDLFDWLEDPKDIMAHMMQDQQSSYKREEVESILTKVTEHLDYTKTVMERIYDVVEKYRDSSRFQKENGIDLADKQLYTWMNHRDFESQNCMQQMKGSDFKSKLLFNPHAMEMIKNKIGK